MQNLRVRFDAFKVMLGQLADPEFTVKTAVISTTYPGASPQEVEQEVTDRIEPAIQGTSQLDCLKEISLVKGVSRVDLWGVQQKVIYIDVAQQQLTELGMTDESVLKTLNQQNMVVDAGSLDLQQNRYRIALTGAFESPLDIADVVIRPSLEDQVLNLMAEVAADGVEQWTSSSTVS